MRRSAVAGKRLSIQQHRDRVVQRLDTARRHLRAIEAKIAYFQAAVEQDAEDMPGVKSV
jgi:hypothetical protein